MATVDQSGKPVADADEIEEQLAHRLADYYMTRGMSYVSAHALANKEARDGVMLQQLDAASDINELRAVIRRMLTGE